MSDDLCFMPATDLVAAYAARKLSPVEVTKAVLARIEKVDPAINSYCLVDAEAALASARASESRWQQSAPIGRVDGVPTSIKDLQVTKGWPTLRGSRLIDPAQPWTEDSPIVARLREHGAVLLGKTTTPEYGWKGVTDNPLTGITRNPWKLDRTPGGSSGGASAALAAGLGQLATGSDAGGSIRIPAGFAGVVGIKATYGRVPAWPASAFGTLSHTGPMARTVADTALMLDVVSGPDHRDWLSLPPPEEDFTESLEHGVSGLRVAYSPALGYADVHPEIAAAVDVAARRFADLGARVEAVDPGFSNPHEIFLTHWYGSAYGAFKHLTAEQRAQVDPGLIRAIDLGAGIGLADFLAAASARAQLAIKMQEFMTRFDLLLTPTLAVPAFAAGQLEPAADGTDWTRWTPFSYPFNLTGQPAISVPCGFTKDGLPIGLQIVGARFADALVLRAAHAYEQSAPLYDRRPPL